MRVARCSDSMAWQWVRAAKNAAKTSAARWWRAGAPPPFESLRNKSLYRESWNNDTQTHPEAPAGPEAPAAPAEHTQSLVVRMKQSMFRKTWRVRQSVFRKTVRAVIQSSALLKSIDFGFRIVFTELLLWAIVWKAAAAVQLPGWGFTNFVTPCVVSGLCQLFIRDVLAHMVRKHTKECARCVQRAAVKHWNNDAAWAGLKTALGLALAVTTIATSRAGLLDADVVETGAWQVLLTSFVVDLIRNPGHPVRQRLTSAVLNVRIWLRSKMASNSSTQSFTRKSSSTQNAAPSARPKQDFFTHISRLRHIASSGPRRASRPPSPHKNVQAHVQVPMENVRAPKENANEPTSK